MLLVLDIVLEIKYECFKGGVRYVPLADPDPVSTVQGRSWVSPPIKVSFQHQPPIKVGPKSSCADDLLTLNTLSESSFEILFSWIYILCLKL